MINSSFKFIGGTMGIFCLMVVMISLIGFQNGSNYDETMNVFQEMQSNFHNRFNPEKLNIESYENELTFSIVKIFYSATDFIMYSICEVIKAGVKFSYNNQDIVNPKTLIALIIISLLAPIILPITKLGIVIFLLVREKKQSRKEKKELEKYKT